jgi:hypothetical protein
MHAAVKLLTGLAATLVLARGAAMHEGHSIIGQLGWHAGQAMMKNGVEDGSVTFRRPGGTMGRIAYLSGTADPATRAAVIASLKRHPGIKDARWVKR